MASLKAGTPFVKVILGPFSCTNTKSLFFFRSVLGNMYCIKFSMLRAYSFGFDLALLNSFIMSLHILYTKFYYIC